jgi:quercetin dioxygenase-like cupin family protein
MKKITIPGFNEIELSNCIISSLEDLNENIPIENTGIQVFFLSFKPGEVHPLHTHPEIRLTVVRAGKVTFEMEGHSKELDPGDIVCAHPNVPHSIAVVGNETLRLVEIVVHQ